MNEHTASFALQVREDQCIGCGMCADACAYGAIRMAEYPEIDPYKCRLCGSCVQACPSEALALNEPETQTQISGGTSKGIWVLAETEADGTLSAVTKELLGKAAVLAEKLHQDVEALLIGSESDAAVSSLAAADTSCRASVVGFVHRRKLCPCCRSGYPRMPSGHLAGRRNTSWTWIVCPYRGPAPNGFDCRLHGVGH